MELSDIETRFREIKESYGKSVKDTTVRNNAKMIAKIMGATEEEVWMKPEVVTEWIESNNFSKTTERNYYSLMLAMANWEREFSKKREDVTTKNVATVASAVGVYIEKIRDLEKEITKNKKERKVSEKKVDQQVAPSMVYDIIDGLRHNNHDAEALILELLMKYPYRAEVGTLKLLTEPAQYRYLQKKAGEKGLTENYLVMGWKHKMMISRSDYKTFDQYGTIENDITDKVLKDKLRQYVIDNNIKPKQPLFGFTDKQDVSKRLGYITKKLSGVSLGPAAVVKIMLSNQKFKDMAEAADFLREASRIRGTALNVLQDVYLHSVPLED